MLTLRKYHVKHSEAVFEWMSSLDNFPVFFFVHINVPKNWCVVGCFNVFEKGKISFIGFHQPLGML